MKTERKNFNKNYPLHTACGLDDKFRISHHYISFQNGYAYATDSHILVRAKLTDISNFDEQELAFLDGKFIHANTFKQILKSKGDVSILENEIVVTEDEYTIKYPLHDGSNLRFPKCETVLGKNELNNIKKEFGISAKLLNKLSDIMNCQDGIVMKWETDHMFSVVPYGIYKTVDIKGVIMTKIVE